MMMSNVGTPLYASPEITNNFASYDYKVDLWALGLVLYEMLTGKPAFVNAKNMEKLKRLQMLGFRGL